MWWTTTASAEGQAQAATQPLESVQMPSTREPAAQLALFASMLRLTS